MSVLARLRRLARRLGIRTVIFRLSAWAGLPLRRFARFVEHIAPAGAGRWLRRREWLWQPGYTSRWLNHFYRRDDPFEIISNPYETSKYEHTLIALDQEHYGSALEIGCSVGVFTKLLAARSDHVLGLDISERALEQARATLAGTSNVTLERRMLPNEMPSGPFDLIVCSDVLYYWPEDVLLHAIPLFAQALAPGGTLLLVHFLGNFGQSMSGQRVHDLMHERLPLVNEFGETVEDVGPQNAGYRLDRFRKPSA